MVAAAGGTDVLIAYPLVGPNLARLARLVEPIPTTTFRATGRPPRVGPGPLGGAARASTARSRSWSTSTSAWAGPGSPPATRPPSSYRLVAALPTWSPTACTPTTARSATPTSTTAGDRPRPGIEAVLGLRDRLLAAGLPVPRLVLGGTPTFPIHAELDEPGVECSPGTCVAPRRRLRARSSPTCRSPRRPSCSPGSISRPGPAGSASTSATRRSPPTRPALALALLGLPDATLGGQSEEHLVVETPAGRPVPRRARPCWPSPPTSARPAPCTPAYVIEGGEVVDEWEVQARDRVLGI